jgi:hypothetical protein
MGRDFILVPLTEEHEKQVASISFDNIDVELPDDLSTSNLQFLCDVDNEVSISNTVIREFLCKHRDTPIRGKLEPDSSAARLDSCDGLFPHS